MNLLDLSVVVAIIAALCGAAPQEAELGQEESSLGGNESSPSRVTFRGDFGLPRADSQITEGKGLGARPETKLGATTGAGDGYWNRELTGNIGGAAPRTFGANLLSSLLRGNQDSQGSPIQISDLSDSISSLSDGGAGSGQQFGLPMTTFLNGLGGSAHDLKFGPGGQLDLVPRLIIGQTTAAGGVVGLPSGGPLDNDGLNGGLNFGGGLNGGLKPGLFDLLPSLNSDVTAATGGPFGVVSAGPLSALSDSAGGLNSGLKSSASGQLDLVPRLYGGLTGAAGGPFPLDALSGSAGRLNGGSTGSASGPFDLHVLTNGFIEYSRQLAGRLGGGGGGKSVGDAANQVAISFVGSPLHYINPSNGTIGLGNNGNLSGGPSQGPLDVHGLVDLGANSPDTSPQLAGHLDIA